VDTEGVFYFEGDDVVTYPNVQYKDTLNGFMYFDFADHIIHETRTFQISQKINPFSLLFISLLIRDRYFPALWPSIIENPLEPIKY
jgi:hypothetical protein